MDAKRIYTSSIIFISTSGTASERGLRGFCEDTVYMINALKAKSVFENKIIGNINMEFTAMKKYESILIRNQSF